MKISFTTPLENLNLENGYGNAGYNVSAALQRLGHEVPFQDPTAPVEIAFNQPVYTKWSNRDQYRIQYTPWESTELPEGWLEGFKDAHEVWTPSPVVARWYEDAGVENVKVYEHGIDPIWFGARHQRRREDRPLQFLHHGEPAPRKGGQLAMDAFRAVFGDSKDVHLTFKSYGHSRVRAREVVDGEMENVGAPDEVYDNVSVVRHTLSPEVLVRMYHSADVLVYPGWGEGFGLIPLQALAAGMPTICTEAWAPYRDFLLPELKLSSTLEDSPWPMMHPGKMFRPSFKDLCLAYEAAYNDFDELARLAFRKSFVVEDVYSWDRLTEIAFRPIVEKFS